MRFTVLIIEDDPTMIDSLRSVLETRLDDVKVEGTGFEKARTTVESLRPDAVIMDVFEDQTGSTASAGATWEHIWDVHFCPVVVHSARDMPTFLEGKQQHPFVCFQPKTADSQERVVDKLASYRTHVDSLRAFNDEVAMKAAESLRHVSLLVWKEAANENDRRDILVRLTRRRLAASFDSPTYGGTRMQAWEQYIYPPLSSDLLTGDILRETRGDPDEPSAFRVVLSPSCDLVVSQGAVEKALVARCDRVSKWLKKVGLDATTAEKKLRERLPKEVTRDQQEGVRILPGLPDHIPLMAVDLKDLHLVPLTAIDLTDGDAGRDFVRVCSIDSPFREQLAWAYVQVCGRPAMPVTNAADFTEKIIRTIKAGKGA
ncbi:MAG: hypothetical protein AB1714_00660 [Acidobacteriota bacterium]